MKRSSHFLAFGSSTIAVAVGQGVLVPWAVKSRKLKKLARRVKHLLSESDREHAQHAQALGNVLRKLDTRQSELEERLPLARDNDEWRTLRQRIAVVKAMRKKGVRLLQEERCALG